MQAIKDVHLTVAANLLAAIHENLPEYGTEDIRFIDLDGYDGPEPVAYAGFLNLLTGLDELTFSVEVRARFFGQPQGWQRVGIFQVVYDVNLYEYPEEFLADYGVNPFAERVAATFEAFCVK